MTQAALLARRLANFRATAAVAATRAETPGGARARPRTAELAARLVAALDAEAVETNVGTVVRIERPARTIPIDRGALARLPGQPPPDVPLVCLDTETTGL